MRSAITLFARPRLAILRPASSFNATREGPVRVLMRRYVSLPRLPGDIVEHVPISNTQRAALLRQHQRLKHQPIEVCPLKARHACLSPLGKDAPHIAHCRNPFTDMFSGERSDRRLGQGIATSSRITGFLSRVDRMLKRARCLTLARRQRLPWQSLRWLGSAKRPVQTLRLPRHRSTRTGGVVFPSLVWCLPCGSPDSENLACAARRSGVTLLQTVPCKG